MGQYLRVKLPLRGGQSLEQIRASSRELIVDGQGGREHMLTASNWRAQGLDGNDVTEGVGVEGLKMSVGVKDKE